MSSACACVCVCVCVCTETLRLTDWSVFVGDLGCDLWDIGTHWGNLRDVLG